MGYSFTSVKISLTVSGILLESNEVTGVFENSYIGAHLGTRREMNI